MFGKISVRCLLFVLLCVSIDTTPCQAQSKASDTAIRWKFSQGQKYKLQMQQNMTQSMTMQEQPMKTSNNTTTYMSWEVTEVDDAGMATIESTIDRITMTMDSPMGNVQVDTTNEKDEPGLATQMGGMFRPMIGVKFKQKMSSRGKISDVEIPEEAFAGIPKGPMGQAAMSPEQLKEMTTKVSPVFPEEELEVGKTWNDVSESSTPVGKIKIDNTYKYEGTTSVDDRLAHRIGITTLMEFPAEANQMGMTIKVTDQDTKGTLYFDQQKGQMMKSEVDQNMTLKINAAGHEIEQQLEQKVRATFTEVSAS